MQWFVFNLFVLSTLLSPGSSYNVKTITTANIQSRSVNCNMKLDNLDKILEIPISEDKDLGRFIVEQTSSLLPHVDTIGHKVLHANNEFITYILNLHTLPDNIKKEIVLFSIRLAQYGDNAGAHMLQFYYDLVDKCL
tara:strand:+ start:10 stop:420 length:411 start_codon:yes stop_codon:yes gene_type:complete